MRRNVGQAGIVIVGASHAGATLAATLRQKKVSGPILLVGAEPNLPYHRPPLSKDLLAGTTTAERILLRPASFYHDQDIELLSGTRAVTLDRDARQVGLSDGRNLSYGRLVLATGTRARHLPIPGNDLAGVHYLRTLRDATALGKALAPGTGMIVVGGGYIGLEVAAAARRLDVDVTIIERADAPLRRVASDPICSWVRARHEANGVDFRFDATVERLIGADATVRAVALSDGTVLPADLVVLGVGAEPTTELAQAAALQVDDGILVDSQCRTSDPDIFAIGDCARYPCAWTGRSQRLESIQNAQDQARVAAAAIAGETEVAYEAVPWFWSDQGADKLQSAGLPLPDDKLVIEGDPEAGSFTVFHLRNGCVAASESVNDARTHMRSRRLIRERARSLT